MDLNETYDFLMQIRRKEIRNFLCRFGNYRYSGFGQRLFSAYLIFIAVKNDSEKFKKSPDYAKHGKNGYHAQRSCLKSVTDKSSPYVVAVLVDKFRRFSKINN